MPNNDRMMKAIDVALDHVKQLLVFSTALIGLTITFNNDLVPASDTRSHTLLLIGWLVMIGSMLFGLFTLGGASARLSTDEPLETVIWKLRYFSFGQMSLLAVALGLLLWAVVPHLGGV